MDLIKYRRRSDYSCGAIKLNNGPNGGMATSVFWLDICLRTPKIHSCTTKEFTEPTLRNPELEAHQNLRGSCVCF